MASAAGSGSAVAAADSGSEFVTVAAAVLTAVSTAVSAAEEVVVGAAVGAFVGEAVAIVVVVALVFYSMIGVSLIWSVAPDSPRAS